MALTPSNMLPLLTPAPDFALPDAVSGRVLHLGDVAAAQGTVIMFLANHCPYVQHVLAELVRLRADYAPRGIAFVAIASNDFERYPQDGPAAMKQLAEARGFGFPYLFDATQGVARAYQAACTPDFYLFDGARQLYYRGRLDDSTPGNGRPLTGADLRAALDALLSGVPAPEPQQPSMGCNIKWREA